MSKSETATFINEKGVLHYKAGELKEALLCWEEAAKLGNPSAMFGLGVIYLNDNSIQNNLSKAEAWFKKAANAGHKNAIIQLNKIDKIKTMSNNKNLKIYLEKNTEYKNKQMNINKPYSNPQEIIKIGNYEWIIINKESNKILCVTKNIIDIRRYNEDFKNITWENCTLRKWLNYEFLSEFSATDQDKIKTTTLKNNNNPVYGTFGGVNTQDKIFLLSFDEVVKYFVQNNNIKYVSMEKLDLLEKNSDDEIRKAYLNIKGKKLKEAKNRYGLDYSKINGQALGWWLRSPGMDQNHAMRVNCNGTIRVHGRIVNRNLVGVRPALWLNI